MKIYLQEKKVLLVGKSWEIKTKLKEYGKTYELVIDWIQDNQKK